MIYKGKIMINKTYLNRCRNFLSHPLLCEHLSPESGRGLEKVSN